MREMSWLEALENARQASRDLDYARAEQLFLHALARAQEASLDLTEAEKEVVGSTWLDPTVPQRLGGRVARRITTLEELGWLYATVDEFEGKERTARELLALYDAHPEQDLRDRSYYLSILASALADQGKDEEAEQLFLAAGPQAVHSLAGFYRRRGRLAEAEPLYQQILARRRRSACRVLSHGGNKPWSWRTFTTSRVSSLKRRRLSST